MIVESRLERSSRPVVLGFGVSSTVSLSNHQPNASSAPIWCRQGCRLEVTGL